MVPAFQGLTSVRMSKMSRPKQQCINRTDASTTGMCQNNSSQAKSSGAMRPRCGAIPWSLGDPFRRDHIFVLSALICDGAAAFYIKILKSFTILSYISVYQVQSYNLTIYNLQLTIVNNLICSTNNQVLRKFINCKKFDNRTWIKSQT